MIRIYYTLCSGSARALVFSRYCAADDLTGPVQTTLLSQFYTAKGSCLTAAAAAVGATAGYALASAITEAAAVILPTAATLSKAAF